MAQNKTVFKMPKVLTSMNKMLENLVYKFCSIEAIFDLFKSNYN